MNRTSLNLVFAGTVAASAALVVIALSSSRPAAPDPVESASTPGLYHPAPQLPLAPVLCGEPVPLEVFGVRESLDRELVVNAYHHSSTMLYMKRANRWFPLIEPILAEEGIPDDMKYLAVIESGLAQVVSPSGASGFWQFMKRTAPAYGLEVNDEVDERYHVAASTRAACAYLREAHERFGSWALAAASYNMGMAGVERELAKQGVATYWDLHLNPETARYVYRLLAIKEVFEDPKRFGFELAADDLYPALATKEVEVDQTISDLSAFAREQGTTLKALKALNPWLTDDFLPISAGNSYRIALPA
jgi:membrane-bound lytic murein transglycosylase D